MVALSPPEPPGSRAAAALAALRSALPVDAMSTDARTIARYATDWTGLCDTGQALAVLRPGDVDQVRRIMQIAHHHRVAVVVRGAGTGLSGAATAPAGGLVLSTERLDRIRSIDPADGIAVVEPGVITAAVDAAAAAHGLRYAPDPASHGLSTIGGNIATNAGGLRCVKYGVTRESVLALDVMLADGTLISTGHRTIKGVTGLDLVGLFVGSEGTLGVVVGATLRLRPLPVRTETLVAFTASLAAAGLAVAAIARSRVQPSMVELMDAGVMSNIDAHRGSDLSTHGRALLLVQTDGHGADREAAELVDVVAAAGVDLRRVHGAEADRFVELRRTGRGAATRAVEGRRGRGGAPVPLGGDDPCGGGHRGSSRDAGGHAGACRRRQPASVAVGTQAAGGVGPPAALEAAADELVRTALGLGGTITGEHGIGIVKRRWLRDELGQTQFQLQQAVKAVFDPRNILAPNSFLAEGGTEPHSLVHLRERPGG